MKQISKFIKGILLITLFISIFSLNIQPILQNTAETSTPNGGQAGYAVETRCSASPEMKFADYFTTKAFAQSDTSASGASEEPITVRIEKDPIDAKAIMQTVARASTYVNSLFNPLIHFFTFNIGNFLGNDYIFAGHMSDMLHSIWVVSRNIVNIIFVLILLFLAVRHIFGGEEGGNTDLKKTLPMFVIMLIAINFSWLGGKVILDAANVATNVVFQIPAGVQEVAGEGLSNSLEECKPSENITKPPTGACMPSAFYYPADSKITNHYFGDDCNKKEFELNYADAYPKDKAPNKKNEYYGTTSICWKKMDIGAYNQNNASYFLSFSMARVQNLTLASTDKDLDKVAIGVLFSLIIQIVYLAAFLALYLALIIRVAALWFLMAFSPFLVLMHYLTKDLNVPGSDKFSIKAFVNWAFVPAAVGAVWSVGFIMITTGQTMTGDIFAKLNQAGGITSSVFSMKSIFMGMESWQQFIWLIMTIGIIWIGTFAALSKLPVVGAVVGKIDDYGKRAAKVIGSAPMWAPIMPLYDYKTGKMDWNKRMSLGKLSPVSLLEKMKNTYESDSMSTTGKFHKASQNIKNFDKSKIDELNTAKGEDAIKLLNRTLGVNFSKADILKNDGKSFKNLVEQIGKEKGLTSTEQTNLIHKATIWANSGTVPVPVDKGKDKPKTPDELRREADARVQAEKNAVNRVGGTTPVVGGTTPDIDRAGEEPAAAKPKPKPKTEGSPED